MTKDDVHVLDVVSFNRSVGRMSYSEIVKPQFIAPDAGDYRLKDFTPGFFTGADKKAIGIQYSYTKE